MIIQEINSLKFGFKNEICKKSKSEKMLYLYFGMIVGVLICLIIFLTVIHPTMKRLEEKRIEYIENQISIDVDHVYEIYSVNLQRLDPNDKWFDYDVHALKLELHLWMQENESILTDEQKEKFDDLYELYCSLESENKNE